MCVLIFVKDTFKAYIHWSFVHSTGQFTFAILGKIQEESVYLWNLSTQPDHIGFFENESSRLGIRDKLNMNFVHRPQDFYQDLTLSQSTVDGMCADIEEALGDQIHNPFLRLQGELHDWYPTCFHASSDDCF